MREGRVQDVERKETSHAAEIECTHFMFNSRNGGQADEMRDQKCDRPSMMLCILNMVARDKGLSCVLAPCR